MDEGLEYERIEYEGERQHASLAVWAVVLKVAAWLCWIGGVLVAFWQGRLVRFAGASGGVVLAFLYSLFVAFVAGAFFWAIALILVSVGQIEKNTRIAARALTRKNAVLEEKFSQSP